MNVSTDILFFKPPGLRHPVWVTNYIRVYATRQFPEAFRMIVMPTIRMD